MESIIVSVAVIMYHLLKAFMTYAGKRYLFSIAELIVSNILSFQILYLDGRNLQNPESIAVLNFSVTKPSKRSTFNVNEPEGVKYLTRLHLCFSHLNEHKFRHGFLDTLNPYVTAVSRL